MKFHYLAPTAALVVAGVWLGIRQRSITTPEKETVLLRQHIGAARQAVAPDARADGATAPEPAGWKDLAAKYARSRDAGALLKLLGGLSGAELNAALDDFASLELGDDAGVVENMMIHLLREKDPRLAVSRLLDKFDDPRDVEGRTQLTFAFRTWLEKDSVAALAWYDAQVAAGKLVSKSLDGKSESRLEFEAAAVASLVSTDPEAARRRVAAWPEAQRRELFLQGRLGEVKPGSEKAYVALVREHVPEEERGKAFAGMMNRSDDYGKAAGFLDGIGATPGERKEVARRTAADKVLRLAIGEGIDRAAVDEMRGWVATQAPGDVEAITGEVLGKLTSPQMKWQDRAKLIEELHAENPSDALLLSFLGAAGATREYLRHDDHREEAKALAGKIADEAKRAELLARIGLFDRHADTAR